MHMPVARTFLFASLACSGWAQSSFVINTIAGSRSAGDGGPALAAPLAAVEGVAVDGAGNIYLADAPDHRIRRIRPNGLIETVAGTGEAGFSGDGGPGTQARVNSPYGVAVDGRGNVFFCDYGNQRVRRIAVNGTVSTVAGGGTATVSYFGAPTAGPQAQLAGPRNLVFDNAGNLYFSDYAAHRVLRLAPDGQLSHFAGGQKAGTSADAVVAMLGLLKEPTALAVDRAGAVYIADAGNYAIRRVFGGTMTRVTSTGTAARATFDFITGLAIDATGELYVAEGRSRPLRRISPQGGVVQFSEGGRDVAVDLAGNAVIADGGFVRRLTRQSTAVIAGNGQYFFGGENGMATEARLRAPSGLAMDRAGNLYIADRENHRVRRLGVDGKILTVAGTGVAGAMTAATAATAAPLNQPSSVAVDPEGAVWVIDAGNRAVRRFWPGGRMEPGLTTGLRNPTGLAIDAAGNLYIADAGQHRVLSYSPRDGSLAPVAGTGVAGNGGDGKAPLLAELNRPTGLAFDADGQLLICDTGNSRIRRVTSAGLIEPYAPTGFIEPTGIVADRDGVYLTDTGAHRVVWLGANGARAEVAGRGVPGFGGDGGPGVEALLQRPAALLVTPAGELIVADTDNHVVRQLGKGGLVVSNIGTTTLLSAASQREAPVAPGALIRLVGAGLGPAQGVAASVGLNGRFDTRLEGVEVRFDGLPAPLLYVQESEIHLQVPAVMQGRARCVVEVWWQGALRARASSPVEDLAPRVFLLDGTQARALNEDGNLNLAENPAERGSLVTLFATGIGPWDRELPDGTPAVEGLTPRETVTVLVDGRSAEVVSARAAVGLLGTLAVTVRAPLEAPAGTVDVVLRVGAKASGDRATIALR